MNSIITTPTNQLANSLEFYSKLGFKTLSKENPVLVTDGKVVIEIDPKRTARAGVKLYKKSWEKEKEALSKLVNVISFEGGCLFSDPSGTRIYLMESTLDLEFAPSETAYSALGGYRGLTLETADILLSAKIFEILGFQVTMGSAEKGWVVYTNEEGFGLSLMKPLMCPHLFFNPSLTYFNSGKNIENIEKIRALNIPITEEISQFNKEGIVDNIIIRDPGGYGFFIFND